MISGIAIIYLFTRADEKCIFDMEVCIDMKIIDNFMMEFLATAEKNSSSQ